MRVGIIGLINHDTIFMAGGRRIQDLGGILYNTTVMADLVGEGDALYPISRIGTDCYDAMRAILDPRPAVSNRGVRVSRTGTSRNRIRYDEEMEKVEQLTNHIGLETMAAVRERATGLLYLDMHNLCLGFDAEGYRQRRAPGDWHRWIEMFDVVQMNEVEARLLAGVPGGLLETVDDFIAFGRSVTALGPSVCVITRGPLGPATVYRKDRETRAIAIPSEPAREVVDTTGCGDAFAAGFVVEYAGTKDPIGATRLANRVASVNCTVAGLPNTGTFSDIRL